MRSQSREAAKGDARHTSPAPPRTSVVLHQLEELMRALLFTPGATAGQHANKALDRTGTDKPKVATTGTKTISTNAARTANEIVIIYAI